MINEIQQKIKKKGYWRVIIRPSQEFYKKDRFELSKLVGVIEKAQVRLRGWYYPHINREELLCSLQDRVSNWCECRVHVEYWDFSLSGQFSHLLTMKEEYSVDEKKEREIKSGFVFSKHKVKRAKSFLEVVSTVYELTEIYLFAANLAQFGQYTDVDTFEIIIELHGVKNRMLFLWEHFHRELVGAYIFDGTDNVIHFKDTYKKDELIAKSDSIAIEKAIKIFQYFNWIDPNKQVLRGDQQKLLKGTW